MRSASDNFFALIDGFKLFELTEVSETEFAKLPLSDMIGLPAIYCRGKGVWPNPLPKVDIQIGRFCFTEEMP